MSVASLTKFRKRGHEQAAPAQGSSGASQIPAVSLETSPRHPETTGRRQAGRAGSWLEEVRIRASVTAKAV